MTDLKNDGDVFKSWFHETHEVAKSKGWHDKPSCCMSKYFALLHGEVSEAMEDDRVGKHELYFDQHGKPCGLPSELADIVLRVFDMCGEYDIDLFDALIKKMAYNKTRPHKHGGKKY